MTHTNRDSAGRVEAPAEETHTFWKRDADSRSRCVTKQIAPPRTGWHPKATTVTTRHDEKE